MNDACFSMSALADAMLRHVGASDRCLMVCGLWPGALALRIGNAIHARLCEAYGLDEEDDAAVILLNGHLQSSLEAAGDLACALMDAMRHRAENYG